MNLSTKDLSDLGFNPTARSRLGLAEVKRASKLQELRSNSAGVTREKIASQRNRRKKADEPKIIEAEVISIASDR